MSANCDVVAGSKRIGGADAMLKKIPAMPFNKKIRSEADEFPISSVVV